MKTQESLLALWRGGIVVTSALLFSLFTLSAQAVVLNELMVTVIAGNDRYDFTLFDTTRILSSVTVNGKTTYVIADYTVNTGEYSFTIGRALLDPDPSISYAISVIDFGAPTAFLFSFFTPIVPTGSPNLVSAALSVTSLTDSDFDGIADMTGEIGGGKFQRSQVGSPLTAMGVDLSPGESFGPTSGPVGNWTSLQVDVGFTLTGGGDGAGLEGFASINEALPDGRVPEPAILTLMGLGLAGTGYTRHRGKKAA